MRLLPCPIHANPLYFRYCIAEKTGSSPHRGAPAGCKTRPKGGRPRRAAGPERVQRERAPPSTARGLDLVPYLTARCAGCSDRVTICTGRRGVVPHLLLPPPCHRLPPLLWPLPWSLSLSWLLLWLLLWSSTLALSASTASLSLRRSSRPKCSQSSRA